MKVAEADRFRNLTDEELLSLHPKELGFQARFRYADEVTARGLQVEGILEPPAVEGVLTLTKGDSRKPILYLRPFGVDKQKKRGIGTPKHADWVEIEALFLLPFRRIGPVVAINSPGDDVQLWRSRSYTNPALRLLPSDDWKRLFSSVLEQAQLVVIFAGYTESLLWEIEQVFSHEPFVPTFVLIPEMSRESTRRLGEIIQSATGVEMPSTPVLYFPSRNEIIPISKSADDKVISFHLHSFVGPLSRALDVTHPGVRHDCLSAAYEVLFKKIAYAVVYFAVLGVCILYGCM